MKKLPNIFKYNKLNFYLICIICLFIGWELHVFKLWTADILNKAKICEETNCLKIMNMATELQDYNLPVEKPLKKQGG